MRNEIKIFWKLCNKASLAWEESPDTKAYEASLMDILTHVKSFPEFEDEFIKCFVEIVNTPKLAVHEIVIYCMRELKWKSVYDAAYRIHCESLDIREKHIAEDILAVYENDWDNEDLWDYYSKGK